MTRFSTLAVLAMFINAHVQGFSSMARVQRATALSVSATEHLPYFIQDDVVAKETQDSQASSPQLTKKPAPNNNSSNKKNSAHHQQGLFSPAVQLAKNVLGETELNRIRGNAIAMHSDTIKSFVATAETTEFGANVLRTLYKMADRNGNGKMEMEELEAFLKRSLGFRFLGDKQIHGIFKRAGGEEKGFISLEEWLAEAPKTLKTNLIKLAKTNGGELGFLV